MRRSLITLVVLTALSPLGHAAPIEHSGKPQSSIAALGHYGIDVPTKRGLKAITPEGWGVYLHKDAVLPAAMAWVPTDTWLSALQSFSDKSGLKVAVDWNSRSIYIKPVSESAAPGVPTLYGAGERVADKGAVASSRVSLETAFRDAAAERGYSVNWSAGALTAASVPALTGLTMPAAMEKMATLLEGKATVSVDTITKTVDVTPGKGKFKIVEAAPAVVLKLPEGGLMSQALADLATKSGWSLRWNAPDDFEAAADSSLSGADFRAVLEKALVRMDLQAEWYPASKVAVVVKKH